MTGFATDAAGAVLTTEDTANSAVIGGLLRNKTTGALVVRGPRPVLFFDDFVGAAGAAVSSQWTQDVGRYSLDQGGNDYVTAGTNNVRLDGNSNLEIRVLKEAPPDAAVAPNNFTSGRVTTKNKAKFLPPVRIEARISLPLVQGLLPSFWTSGLQPGTWTEDWPKYGEIDVAEQEGLVGSTSLDTYIHMGTQADITVDVPLGFSTPLVPYSSPQFKVYGVDWFPDRMRFHVDGVTTGTITSADALAAGNRWPFDVSPHFLLLTCYVGPDWMAEPDAAQSWPQSMLVDWVKVTAL